VPQVLLDEPGVHASFEQMGGIRMPEGMDGDAHFGDTGPLFGDTEGALDTGPPHRVGGQRALLLIAPGSGKEPGLVPVGFPVGAEQCERLFGQGDVPVLGVLPAMDMDLKAVPVNIGDLQGQSFMEPESQAIDGGEVDLVVQGGSGRQEALDLLHTEHGGETVRDLRANEREGVPIAFEDVLIEEADATVADTHGGWGEAVDVFPVQEVALQFLFGDAVGGFVVELGQQADFSDIGYLRPFAFAAEVERRDHLLTQWAHVVSPFVRRVVDVRRKTS